MGDIIGFTNLKPWLGTPQIGKTIAYDEPLPGSLIGRAGKKASVFGIIPDFETRPGVLGDPLRMRFGIDKQMIQPTDGDALFRLLWENR